MKNRPETRVFFGDILRPDAKNKVALTTGSAELDRAILWLKDSVKTGCDLRVAHHGLPALVFAEGHQGDFWVVHEEPAYLEAVKKGFSYHKQAHVHFVTRLEDVSETAPIGAFMALGMTDEKSVETLSKTLFQPKFIGVKTLLSYATDLPDMTAQLSMGATVVHETEYTMNNQAYRLFALRLHEVI